MYRILFSCLLCVSLGVLALGGRIQETTETTLNPAHLAKSFNLKKFELMSDENFSGIVSIDKHISGKQLKAIAGKYIDAKQGEKSCFVLLLNVENQKLDKEAIFEFYAEKIDNVNYENEKIYVIFKEETEMYGWIEWTNNDFKFILFHDPEL